MNTLYYANHRCAVAQSAATMHVHAKCLGRPVNEFDRVYAYVSACANCLPGAVPDYGSDDDDDDVMNAARVRELAEWGEMWTDGVDCDSA